jgi:pyruvate/2-oxoglutarate dehydrogenase complex dihydrolipoamide dehydrogenase (E3) component
MKELSAVTAHESAESLEVSPRDEHNEELVRQAHPPDWKNPTPDAVYNLVAVGGGTAGIISALGAAGLGGKAALVERHLLGGDCLNYGCVPSKALIRAARAVHQARIGERYGVYGISDARVDFAGVMRRMRRLRARISHHDSAQRFTDMGVDIYLASARFTGRDRLDVGGQELRFRRCVIATGGRPAAPSIQGLQETGYLTNESVFSLTELPRRLLVLGAGPIGCELAQAFRRFGSEVHLVNRSERILKKEDVLAAGVVQRQFEREGIVLHLGATVTNVSVAAASNGARQVTIEKRGAAETVEVDALLVAVGRTPNIEGLGLEAAGVEANARGVVVNDFLQSSNPHIYAAGDVAGSYQFTHAADAMARACIQNAFFFGRKRLSGLVIPRTTYTDPEIAHVGLTLHEAERQGVEVDSYREELANVDRAVLDGEEDGYAVVHCEKGKGKVLGATIVGSHAGEMIGEVSLLMTKGLTLGALSETVHCYPTQVEVLRRIGDQFNRGRLTPTVAKLLRYVLTHR